MIFHITRATDWESAIAAGSYTRSTLDRTLADEGFIHASYRDQLAGVAERHYAGVVEPLVLLSIDVDLLVPDVIDEAPEGRDERYPHIYGPLNVDAVVAVRALARARDGALVLPE